MAFRIVLLIIAAALSTGSRMWASVQISRITGSAIEALAAADSADSIKVWDFSSCQTLGRASLQYIAKGDSVVMELLPELRSDFKVRGDSLWLTALEGRSWRCLTDTVRILPLSSDSTESTLSFHLSRRFMIEGIMEYNVSSGHSVIIHPGDTITGVRLLTLSFSGHVSREEDEFQEKGHVFKKITAERRYWIYNGSVWPIATDCRLHVCGVIYINKAYLFPPEEHPQQSVSANAIASPLVHGTVMPGNRSADLTDHASFSDDISTEELNPVISVDGYSVTVALASGMGQSDILLCDIAGRVLESHKRVELGTSFHGLRPGEYLISVSCGRTRVTEKISIR